GGCREKMIPQWINRFFQASAQSVSSVPGKDILSQFPRPPADNGRGVHWTHSTSRWGQNDWDFWKEQIQAMNLKWVKVMDDGGGSAQGLVKRLVDLKVMPVVRFYRLEPNPGVIGSGVIDLARRYVEMGAVYFETNNEPDLALEWKNRNRPENWLQIVVDNFIIEADLIRSAGGYLLFPAFGPGGRGNPFKMIVERGRRDILDGNCGLAIHNYCLGRPLDYPNDPVNTQGQALTLGEWEEQGGMWAWEMAYETVNEHRRRLKNPQASIMEDSTCFRAFEYFNALVNEAVGHSIPIFTTEGGYNVGQRAGTTYGDDPRYPKPTPEWTSKLTLDMFKYIETGPDYYFACMPWLIAVQRIGTLATPYENQGPWFTHQFDQQFGLKGELPLVSMLKGYPGRVRQDGPLPAGMKNFYTGPDLAGRSFDERLKYLKPQVLLEPVAEPAGPYWKLIEVRWDEQGHGYTYVKLLDESGQPLEGGTFQAARKDAVDQAQTKGKVDDYWGNVSTRGALGTYKISAVEGGLPSDRLVNVGSGKEDGTYASTSFFLVFQKTNVDGETMFDFKKYRQDFLVSNSVINDAARYGVTIEPADAPEGSWYWKIIGIHHLQPGENDGKHNLFIDAVDEKGARRAEKVAWTWVGRKANEAAPPLVLNQPEAVPAGNLAIWMNQTISARIEHTYSDAISNVHTRHPDEPTGNTMGHHSFYVVWQWTKKEEKPKPPVIPPASGDAEEVLQQIKQLLDAYFARRGQT
ncbi:MAG: hypothetical protein AB1801_23925, partial [Chloroflexota bacterium]